MKAAPSPLVNLLEGPRQFLIPIYQRVDFLAETAIRWSDEDHPKGRPVRLVGLRYTEAGFQPRMERVHPTP